jgi:hypothetical protein
MSRTRGQKSKTTAGAVASHASYELNWVYEPRVVAEQLGRDKYSSSVTALGELIANALDAGARRVDIDTTANPLGGLSAITVSDNGGGMTPLDLRKRFAVVGVGPGRGGGADRLGRFGVGRLAVHRLGSLSAWTTTAKDESGGRVRSAFELRSETPRTIAVTQHKIAANAPTGTTIHIRNIVDDEMEAGFEARLRGELLAQFCSYLLGHPERSIHVNGEALEVETLISDRVVEELPAIPKVDAPVKLHHLLLRRPLDQSRAAGRILFTGKGRTVAACTAEDVASSNYVGLVESAYLDSIVTSNREGVVELDAGFASIKSTALAHVSDFAERVREARKITFLEKAREQSFYPYRAPAANAVVDAKRAIYDVVLERINEHANIEGMSNRQQAVIFRLLDRALDNEDLLEILHEVANLSSEDMEKLRRVLERTTLQSLIRLSSEVTARLEFLDVLHELVYGVHASSLKERSQLHKIVEPHCWIFGPAYHLATSDKSFRSIIRRHREQAELPPAPEDEIRAVPHSSDIPDLFLAAARQYPVAPTNRHLLVELKAPSVSLGWKELQQAKRYAQTVMSSSQFDKAATAWDVFLVSAEIREEIELDRRQKNKEVGCVAEYHNMTVWALSWGEIIGRARTDMQLVREHLEQKSRELSVSTYLQENYPDILPGVSAAGRGPSTRNGPEA